MKAHPLFSYLKAQEVLSKGHRDMAYPSHKIKQHPLSTPKKQPHCSELTKHYILHDQVWTQYTSCWNSTPPFAEPSERHRTGTCAAEEGHIIDKGRAGQPVLPWPLWHSPVQDTRVLSTVGMAMSGQKKSQSSCHSSSESAAHWAFPSTQEDGVRGRSSLHSQSHSYVPGMSSGCLICITAFNPLNLVLGTIIISILLMKKSKHRKVKVRQLRVT